MSSSDLDYDNSSRGVDNSGSEYEYESSSDNNEYLQEQGIDQNDAQEHHRSLFNQEPIACPICCEDEVEEGRALTLPACSHSFCVDCFARCVEAQIGQGDADSITCPFILDDDKDGGGIMVGTKQCNAAVGMDVLHEIMTREAFDKLKYQRDTAFVRKNADYHHCPFPNCTNIVLCKNPVDVVGIVNEAKIGRGKTTTSSKLGASSTLAAAARICDCFKCGSTSCLTCGAMPFHFNKTCNEYRAEQERLKRQHEAFLARQRRRIHRTVCPQPDRSRADDQVRFDFKFDAGDINGNALENVKRCRRCGNSVELQSGCLKMKCICGYRFCYQCGAENAQCDCTPSHHGFIDNKTGRQDFSGLRGAKSYT